MLYIDAIGGTRGQVPCPTNKESRVRSWIVPNRTALVNKNLM